MTSLKDKYKPDMSLEAAERLVLETLKEVMEDKIASENVEMCFIRADTK
jgi:20S proteasome alpha/beta subunit